MIDCSDSVRRVGFRSRDSVNGLLKSFETRPREMAFAKKLPRVSLTEWTTSEQEIARPSALVCPIWFSPLSSTGQQARRWPESLQSPSCKLFRCCESANGFGLPGDDEAATTKQEKMAGRPTDRPVPWVGKARFAVAAGLLVWCGSTLL